MVDRRPRALCLVRLAIFLWLALFQVAMMLLDRRVHSGRDILAHYPQPAPVEPASRL